MNRKTLGAISLALYVATIWLANWAINHYGIVSVPFGYAAPAGVYFAGIAFTLRDTTQDTLGKRGVVAAIIAGAALSYFIGANATIPGGHVSIAVASGAAFLLSEFCDFAVYTPLRERHWLGSVAASNIVGAVIDSFVFLWLAFGATTFWQGQVTGKLTMTALAVIVLAVARRFINASRLIAA